MHERNPSIDRHLRHRTSNRMHNWCLQQLSRRVAWRLNTWNQPLDIITCVHSMASLGALPPSAQPAVCHRLLELCPDFDTQQAANIFELCLLSGWRDQVLFDSAGDRLVELFNTELRRTPSSQLMGQKGGGGGGGGGGSGAHRWVYGGEMVAEASSCRAMAKALLACHSLGYVHRELFDVLTVHLTAGRVKQFISPATIRSLQQYRVSVRKFNILHGTSTSATRHSRGTGGSSEDVQYPMDSGPKTGNTRGQTAASLTPQETKQINDWLWQCTHPQSHGTPGGTDKPLIPFQADLEKLLHRISATDQAPTGRGSGPGGLPAVGLELSVEEQIGVLRLCHHCVAEGATGFAFFYEQEAYRTVAESLNRRLAQAKRTTSASSPPPLLKEKDMLLLLLALRPISPLKEGLIFPLWLEGLQNTLFKYITAVYGSTSKTPTATATGTGSGSSGGSGGGEAQPYPVALRWSTLLSILRLATAGQPQGHGVGGGPSYRDFILHTVPSLLLRTARATLSLGEKAEHGTEKLHFDLPAFVATMVCLGKLHCSSALNESYVGGGGGGGGGGGETVLSLMLACWEANEYHKGECWLNEPLLTHSGEFFSAMLDLLPPPSPVGQEGRKCTDVEQRLLRSMKAIFAAQPPGLGAEYRYPAPALVRTPTDRYMLIVRALNKRFGVESLLMKCSRPQAPPSIQGPGTGTPVHDIDTESGDGSADDLLAECGRLFSSLATAAHLRDLQTTGIQPCESGSASGFRLASELSQLALLQSKLLPAKGKGLSLSQPFPLHSMDGNDAEPHQVHTPVQPLLASLTKELSLLLQPSNCRHHQPQPHQPQPQPQSTEGQGETTPSQTLTPAAGYPVEGQRSEVFMLVDLLEALTRAKQVSTGSPRAGGGPGAEGEGEGRVQGERKGAPLLLDRLCVHRVPYPCGDGGDRRAVDDEPAAVPSLPVLEAAATLIALRWEVLTQRTTGDIHCRVLYCLAVHQLFDCNLLLHVHERVEQWAEAPAAALPIGLEGFYLLVETVRMLGIADSGLIHCMHHIARTLQGSMRYQKADREVPLHPRDLSEYVEDQLGTECSSEGEQDI